MRTVNAVAMLLQYLKSLWTNMEESDFDEMRSQV